MTYEEAKREIIIRNCADCSALSCKGCELWYALEALGKQIPAKPIKQSGYYRCPACGLSVEVDDNEAYATEIYPACRCGKIIDWDGVEDVNKVD